MKSYSVAACALIAMFGVASTANAGPFGQGGTVARFKTTSKGIDIGYGCETGLCSGGVTATVYDDFVAGSMVGAVQVYFRDPDTYLLRIMSCYGPAYAHMLSINAANGMSSLFVVLDPSNTTDCIQSGEFTAPVTVNLSGQDNGTATGLTDGVFLYKDPTQTLRGRNKTFSFTETFNGTLGGATGPFNGAAFGQMNSSVTRTRP